MASDAPSVSGSDSSSGDLDRDVTNYVDRIKEEQSRLLASIESLQLGFLIIDTKNNILIKNSALDRILGIEDMGSILLLGDIEVLCQGLAAAGFDLRQAFEKTILDRSTQEFKDVVFGEKFLHLYIAPVISPLDQSVTTGATIVIEDVTESKVFEQGRDEFFSIASHELRTPLTAINGNASMLVDYYVGKPDESEMKEMADDILESSQRLIQIVNDFLDVSRLEQRRMQFHNEAFDIQDVMQTAVGELRDLALAKKLSLEFQKGETPCLVTADPFRVKQVLTNLIGNAIHYTEAGSIVLTAETVDGQVYARVRDTGVGIAEHQRPLLFRKFQQVGDRIYSREVMSTGLGLYISKMMIEAMNGSIMLEQSEVGKGSTFRIALPIATPISDTKNEHPSS